LQFQVRFMYVTQRGEWEDTGMNTRTVARGPKEIPLTVVCAWCGTCLRRGGSQISHGMCEACAASFFKAS